MGPLMPIGNIKIIPPRILFDKVEYDNCNINGDGTVTLTKIVSLSDISNKDRFEIIVERQNIV